MKLVKAILFVIIAAAVSGAPPVLREGYSVLNSDKFFNTIDGKKQISFTFEGELYTSYITGKNYLHYETIVFVGEENITSSYQVLYHTEKNIIINYGAVKYMLYYKDLRTYLSPAYKKLFRYEDVVGKKTKVESLAYKIMMEQKLKKIILAEYGIEKGKTYYGHCSKEEYNLPPKGKSGSPETRTNRVLHISEKPFPNTNELTPLFKGWSY